MAQVGCAVSITYHGVLYGVDTSDGRFVRLPGALVLGSVDGRGLVVAQTRAELEAGAVLRGGSDWRPVRAVYYRRRRGAPHPGLNWRHELRATELGIGPDGLPRFRHRGSARRARVCPAIPDAFICDG